MKRISLSLAIFLLVSTHVGGRQDPLGGIKLLEGYSVNHASAVDAATWSIEKRDGLRILFEAGLNEGSWANPGEKSKYSWYREQKVNGFTVRFALIKNGLKTQWGPTDSHGLPLGNILLVSFLLDGDKSSHTANFSAKVANAQEIADSLLMVMTFDPSKGSF